MRITKSDDLYRMGFTVKTKFNKLDNAYIIANISLSKTNQI